jgi:hypothetical protein
MISVSRLCVDQDGVVGVSPPGPVGGLARQLGGDVLAGGGDAAGAERAEHGHVEHGLDETDRAQLRVVDEPDRPPGR